MEYIYAELIKNNVRTLASVSPSKLAATAVIVIIDKVCSIEDVPSGYKDEVLSKLEAQGYDGHGEPLA